MPGSFWLPFAAATAMLAAPINAEDSGSAPAMSNGATEIDYAGFAILTADVAAIRAERLIPLEDFVRMAAEDGTLILDARSAASFARGHMAGAVNLPFSDFTQEKLAEVIGADKDRRILIYCNNNFSDNVAPVTLKLAPLALNIPTFINLVGYGYANVWELGETVKLADVAWVNDAATGTEARSTQ